MIKPEPVRKNRKDWWATWKGEPHYIGHYSWIDFDRATATMWYVDRDAGNFVDTPTALKSIELLRKTGIMLIQNDGPDHSFAGWRYACRVSDLEVRGAGFWIKCKLRVIR